MPEYGREFDREAKKMSVVGSRRTGTRDLAAANPS
jgi:hypothetical protein